MIIAGLVIGIGVYRTRSRQAQLAAQIVELGGGGTPIGIEDLRKAISLYEAKIEEYVKDAAQTGSYWKILASRLSDKGLHTEALDALSRAIAYTPEDTALHYLRGVSAGILAKSTLGLYEQQQYYYDLAEKSFLRSIELNNRYIRPRYSLGVLYTFDLDRPDDAIPQLEKYLELSPNSKPINSDIDAMFVLARAYYMVEEYQNSVDLYDRIIANTRDPAKRVDADTNKQVVLDRLYTHR